MRAPHIDLSFPQRWLAQILSARPLILPPRHYVYPRQAEEVERGALEVMVRPASDESEPFLATCALGFGDPAAPTGIWSAPNPIELCVVAGGYAYLIDTIAPERFSMIDYRPVLEVRPELAQGLLLFVGNRGILAWGESGLAWKADRLSDEGITIVGVEGDVLRGLGWKMLTDKETPFAVDLRTGISLPQQ